MRAHRDTVSAVRKADLPSTGNVHVLPSQRRPHADGAELRMLPETARVMTAEWVIHDGDGAALEPALASRSEALRQIGLLAFRGACLPLTLYGPDGEPTGDRLA